MNIEYVCHLVDGKQALQWQSTGVEGVLHSGDPSSCHVQDRKSDIYQAGGEGIFQASQVLYPQDTQESSIRGVCWLQEGKGDETSTTEGYELFR